MQLLLYRNKHKQWYMEIRKVSEKARILRLDLISTCGQDRNSLYENVWERLKHFCGVFKRLFSRKKKSGKFDEDIRIFRLPLREFNFSAIHRYGISFFNKLHVSDACSTKKIESKLDHADLGYVLRYTFSEVEV